MGKNAVNIIIHNTRYFATTVTVPDSAKAEGSSIVDESQGRAVPLCARIESANREVSDGKADR